VRSKRHAPHPALRTLEFDTGSPLRDSLAHERQQLVDAVPHTKVGTHGKGLSRQTARGSRILQRTSVCITISNNVRNLQSTTPKCFLARLIGSTLRHTATGNPDAIAKSSCSGRPAVRRQRGASREGISLGVDQCAPHPLLAARWCWWWRVRHAQAVSVAGHVHAREAWHVSLTPLYAM
jgi:hypothetical protein